MVVDCVVERLVLNVVVVLRDVLNVVVVDLEVETDVDHSFFS